MTKFPEEQFRASGASNEASGDVLELRQFDSGYSNDELSLQKNAGNYISETTVSKEDDSSSMSEKTDTTHASSYGVPASMRRRAKNRTKSHTRNVYQYLYKQLYKDPSNFFSGIIDNFGFHMFFLIAYTYCCIKGFGCIITHYSFLSTMKDHFKVPASLLQKLQAVVYIPWSLKGVIGMLSDGYPLLGYHKKSYMVIFCILGFIGSCLYLYSLITIKSILLTTIGAILMNSTMSVTDLGCEGIYCTAMRKKAHTGASLTSLVWLCIQVADVLTLLVVGMLLDTVPIYYLFAPFVVLIFCYIFVLMYPFPIKSWKDSGITTNEEYKVERKITVSMKDKKLRNLYVCISIMSLIVLATIAIGLIPDPTGEIGMIYSCSAFFIIVITISCTLDTVLLKPFLFMLIANFLSPNLSTQFQYWLMADEDCVPGGPNFSYSYLITVLGVFSAIFHILGLIIFQKYISKWTFRNSYLVTIFIRTFTTIFDFIMLKRWNITVFGISDHMWFLLSNGVVEDLIEMLAYMPTTVLMSRLCPKNFETAAFALSAGISNFSRALSKFTGNYIAISVLGIKSTRLSKEGSTKASLDLSCNFDNLAKGIFVIYGILPFSLLLFSYLLIPNKHMNVNLVDDEEEDEEKKQVESGKKEMQLLAIQEQPGLAEPGGNRNRSAPNSLDVYYTSEEDSEDEDTDIYQAETLNTNSLFSNT